MIDIKERRILKYLLFFSQYYIQGVEATIAWVIIPLYFVNLGMPLPLTSLIIGIIMFPWTIKFIWGGIADYFIEHGRKKFILIGGILFSLGLFAAAFINPNVNLTLFTLSLFICSTGIVILDVAIDAWAIQTSKEKEHGKIGGSMFAGSNIGKITSALLFTYIAYTIGYNYVFILASLIVFIIILFPLFFKEEKITRKKQKITPILIGEFKKKTTQLVSIFSSMILIQNGILVVAIPLYAKIVLKLDDPQIGIIIAIATIAMAIGSLTGGTISDKIGRKKTLYIFITTSILFTSLLIFTDTWQKLTIIYAIIGFLHSGFLSAHFAQMMDVTNPKIGAFQFSILAGISNAGLTGGNVASGSLIATLGFSQVFLYAAWSLGPTLIVLYFIRLKTKKSK